METTMRQRASLAAALLVALALSRDTAIGQGPEPAELVLLNGHILTVDAAFSTAEALAVRHEKFVAVGSNEAGRAHIGPNTRVIDVRGRTVIPGLIDTHVHALDVAAAEAAQPFRNLKSVDDIQTWIRTQTARTPQTQWIWTPRVFPTRLAEHRFPTRAELDAAAPHHAVAVDCAYAFVLNTTALRLAGLTRTSPDPPGGAIVRDASGEPTGLMRNVGGMLARLRPAADAAPLDGLARVHQRYLETGITSIIERGATRAGFDLYQTLRRDGRLRVRSTVTVRIPRPDDATETERFIKSLPFQFNAGDNWLKLGPVKIVADGGILIGTSFMRDPYGEGARSLYGLDDAGDRGFLTLTPQQIAAAVATVHRLGRQVVVHVTGDAGVDVVLDAIEAAQKALPAPDRRHTLLHAYFVHPETAARAAKLGVLIDTQPAWYYKDADALSAALGRERLAHFIGLRTWRAAGVETAINTDHMFGLDRDEAMNPYNPFLTIYTATTRRTESGAIVSGDEAVTREEALRMMTSAAARFSFDEADRGTIQPGRLADFVVLDENILTCPPDRLRSIRADMTIVGGQVAYERATPTR
jgi:predicted amidohydrolase YtcJ